MRRLSLFERIRDNCFYLGIPVFDLNVISLQFAGTELPGLLGCAAPRRSARGRAGDQLVILLALQGGALISQERVKTLTAQLAQTYFDAPGSVTSALRAVVDALNDALLERNLRSASASGRGKQVTALLNLAALHGTHLYLAHCGPTHTLVLKSDASGQAETFTDAALAGHNLGLSRPPAVRYFQAEVGAGTWVLLSPELLDRWNPAALDGVAKLPKAQVLRRLFEPPPAGLNAALVQVQAGSGRVSSESLSLKSAPAPVPVGKPASEAEAAAPEVVKSARPSTVSSMPGGEPLSVSSTAVPVPPVQERPAPVPVPARSVQERSIPIATATTPLPFAPARPAQERAVSTAAPTSPVQERLAPGSRPAPASPPVPAAADQVAAPLPLQESPEVEKPVKVNRVRWLAPIWRSIRQTPTHFKAAFSRFVGRLSPAGTEAPPLSPATRLFIAIAVPVMVAAVALVVYFERGQSEQYQFFYAQAQIAAEEANASGEALALRTAWGKTLVWLDKSDAIYRTDEAAALRQRANAALDQLDGVVRAGYQPAIIGDFSTTVNVTHILSSSNELYLLDATQARIYKATLTSRGYEIDNTFKCSFDTTPLAPPPAVVSFVLLSPNMENKADLMAMDKDGNVLYCGMDKTLPLSTRLSAPPDGWGQINAFSANAGTLVVLDSQKNEVFLYRPSADPKGQLKYDRSRTAWPPASVKWIQYPAWAVMSLSFYSMPVHPAPACSKLRSG